MGPPKVELRVASLPPGTVRKSSQVTTAHLATWVTKDLAALTKNALSTVPLRPVGEDKAHSFTICLKLTVQVITHRPPHFAKHKEGR